MESSFYVGKLGCPASSDITNAEFWQGVQKRVDGDRFAWRQNPGSFSSGFLLVCWLEFLYYDTVVRNAAPHCLGTTINRLGWHKVIGLLPDKKPRLPESGVPQQLVRIKKGDQHLGIFPVNAIAKKEQFLSTHFSTASRSMEKALALFRMQWEEEIITKQGIKISGVTAIVCCRKGQEHRAAAFAFLRRNSLGWGSKPAHVFSFPQLMFFIGILKGEDPNLLLTRICQTCLRYIRLKASFLCFVFRGRERNRDPGARSVSRQSKSKDLVRISIC